MKKVIDFVKSLNTWFEIELTEDRVIELVSREYGDICEDVAGEKDIEEARRLAYIVKEKFPTVTVSVPTVDEWTYLRIEK